MSQLTKPPQYTFDTVAHCTIDPRLQSHVICGCDKCKAERAAERVRIKRP